MYQNSTNKETATEFVKIDCMSPNLQCTNIAPEYLEIDEFSNAIDNLEKAKMLISNWNDPFRWKWVAISLSSACYGLMICAIQGGNHERVIDFKKMPKEELEVLNQLNAKKDAESYFRATEIRRKFVHSRKAKLIGFDDALKWIQQDEWMGQFVFSQSVQLSKEQIKQIKQLRKFFRNNFEHFIPKSWSIETALFLAPSEATLFAIEQLASSGNLNIRLIDEDRLTPAIHAMKLALEKERADFQTLRSAE